MKDICPRLQNIDSYSYTSNENICPHLPNPYWAHVATTAQALSFWDEARNGTCVSWTDEGIICKKNGFTKY